MSYKKHHDPQAVLSLVSALAVPLVQTATYCTWPAVLLMGAVCLFAAWYLSKFLSPAGPWLRLLQNLWICVILSELLHWCAAVWPSHENAWAAPLIILILAVWITSGKGTRAARAGCVLLWPLILMLGTVLLSGIPEIKAENLQMEWRMKNDHLVSVLLIFPLCSGSLRKGGGKPCTWILVLGTAASAITAGVLSAAFSMKQAAPIYELSRSISMFGIAERFESLTAAAMTLGYFASMSFLLEYTKESITGRRTWIYAILAGILFLFDIRLDSRITAIGTILLWAIVPALARLKNNFQKS